MMRCSWLVVGRDAGASAVSIAMCALAVSTVALGNSGFFAARIAFDLDLTDIRSETDNKST